MSRYCPRCGKEHIRNEEYCLDCHTKLPKEEIELNDKNPGSIFRNEKIKNEKIQTVKKNTGLGKIFTYEKTQNIPNEVEQTPKIERPAKPKDTHEISKTLNIFKRKPKEQKTNNKQNNEKKTQTNTQTQKPQTNTQTEKPKTNIKTQKPQTNTRTEKPQTNTRTEKPQTNTQTQKPRTPKRNFEKVKTPNNAKEEKPKDTHKRSITPNIFKRKPKEQKTNNKQNNEKKPQTNTQTQKPQTNTQTQKPQTNTRTEKPQTQKPKTNIKTQKPQTNTQTEKPRTPKRNFEKVKTPNNAKEEKPKDTHERSITPNIFKRKPKEQKTNNKQNNEKKPQTNTQTQKTQTNTQTQKPQKEKGKTKPKVEQKPKINKNKQKPIEEKTPQGNIKTKAKEIKSFSISEEGKRKIIIGGLIVLAILILIIIAGVLTNPALNSNETGHTNYNFTDFVISIPNDYKQNNDTDFITEFTKDNVTVKFYTSNLYGTGYQGTSIEGLQQATVNNIANNLNGTISYNDLTDLDNGYRGYNITYSSGGNVTRDIGFVKDNVEYDIIITTPGNNTEKLDNVSSEIIPTLKIN